MVAAARGRFGRLLLIAGALLLAVPAWAARVHLSVPYQSMEVGQRGQAEITVVDGRPDRVPTLSTGEGLQARFVSQGRSVRIVNFDRVDMVTFTYAIEATQAGTWQLGPATVSVDGQQMQTTAQQVEVSEPVERQAGDDPITAWAETSVDAAWEGQVVLYTYGFRSRLRPLRSRWVKLPTEGLTQPAGVNPVRREYVIDDPEGPIWVDQTTEPFLVTSGDDLELPGAVVALEVPREGARSRRLFPRTRDEVAAADALELAVRRLPTPPPGFSGLVGEFTFDSKVETTRAAVGDSVDWTIRVEGDGTLQGFSLPPTGDLEAARIYDGTPTTLSRVTPEGFAAQGTYQRVVVPTRAGDLQVPPLEIVTFSPGQGRYVTHRLAVPPLEVTPGREGEAELESFAPDVQAPEQQAEPVDIHPIHESGRAHAAFLGPLLPWAALVLVAFGAVPLLLDARDAWRARRAARAQEPLRQPVTRAVQRDPLVRLDERLREAVAGRLDLPVDAVDRQVMRDRLPAPLGAEIAGVARALERARFAGEAAGDDLAERVERAIARLGEVAA